MIYWSIIFVQCVFPLGGFGEASLLRIKTGDRLGDRAVVMHPFSLSGDGDEPPPVAEFRRDGVKRTVASKWRNLCNIDRI